MLETLLVLEAARGRRADLIEYFRQRGVVEAAVPFGLLRGELRSRGLREVVVASRWIDEASYQSWLESPTRADLVQQMADLVNPRVPPRTRTWESSPEVQDARYTPVQRWQIPDLGTSVLLATMLAP